MRAQCQILSEDEKQKVHAESLKILEQVGVKYLSEPAQKIMKDNGAMRVFGEMALSSVVWPHSENHAREYGPLSLQRFTHHASVHGGCPLVRR